MTESDKSIAKDDMNKLFLDSVSKGVDSLDSHHYKDGETGFLGLDSAIGNMVEVGYNTFIGGFTRYLTPKVYATILEHGEGHLDAKPLNRVAAGASFALNTGIYAFPSISEAYKLWSKQHDANLEMVRQLSPVLDELKGKHGIAAYNSVNISQNEMIAHHRWRTAKVNHNNLTNLIIPAIAKMAPNVWFNERDTLEGLKRGVGLDVVREERLFSEVAKTHGKKIAAELNQDSERQIDPKNLTHKHIKENKENKVVHEAIETTEEAIAHKKASSEGFNLNGVAGQLTSNATLTTIANKMVESSTRRLKQSFPTDYTALDMVLDLQKQLGSEPTPRSFQLPNRGRSLPLEAYIAEIMIQHQLDMANMNPDYAVIRDALHENVLAAAKPLAAALSKGDIGALALINYIGSGKIIRNKGRLIASADEVEAMIEHDAGKHVVRVEIDPKDFWSDAPYTAKEAKDAFAVLQGEERQIAITMVPPALRKEFGISEKEGKEADAIPAKQIAQSLSEVLAGVEVVENDDGMRQKRLAKTEIAQVHEGNALIEKSGSAAMDELKSKSTHLGVEPVLLSLVVSSALNGERHYLGKVMQAGREKLDHQEVPEQKPEHAHATREKHRRTKAEPIEMDRD